MSSKIILTNKDLHQIVKQIKEQVEGDYYKISPEEYIQLMSLGSYHGKAITKMRKFQGKPLWITGDLNLSSTPTDSLGNVGYVDGSLNIAYTKVSSIEGTNVKGWVADSNSPRERIREKQELNAKLAQQDILRDNNEWDFKNGDETGEKAHALFENLINNGEIDLLSDEDKEKLTILRRKLQDLEQEYEGLDDNDDRAYGVQEAIDETQSEIDELEENDADVYMMYPNSRYSHYGLQQFEVLIPGFKNNEYSVGTQEEMDEAALQYAKNYVDDVGADGFNESFIEDYLDVDAIVNMAEEDYDYQVRDYPDSYFNDDDFELTEEQEERIAQLESQIEDLEQQKLELDSDDENYYDYEEDLDNQIEALQEELDSIEVDTEPTDDMIENKVAELVRDVRRDPLDYLKNYGLSIKEYIDEDALAQGLVDSDGWGVMNSYDGQYDSEEVNGVTYYIMRVN
jgi:HPt (histidine-containing phosphotransfer) domain-containing protein